jgi:membrane-bound lytic murein transglycosylase MltF
MALFLLPALAACSRSGPAPQTEVDPIPAYEAALPEHLRPVIAKRFTGDLDQMIERRLIRIGAPFNRTFYFIDKGVQRGLSYEYAQMFEKRLNEKFKRGNLPIYVVILPMPRDALLPAVKAGTIDMAVAQLTITPERRQLVDFTNPTRTGVKEVLVTGPDVTISSLDDLAKTKIFVRPSSSYNASLIALDQRLKSEGKPLLDVEAAPESLEDDDLLEMVNSGLVPATVVDDYLAAYWKRIFPNLRLHEQFPLRSGGNLAVATRKNSPQLAGELNAFLAEFGLNSVIGRVLDRKYLQNTDYVMDAASRSEREKFLAMVELFRRFGTQYSFDHLLMAAQGYQESRLDQQAKSAVGAIGVMQLMPATGREQQVGDIGQVEPNIHAGVKYMAYIRNRYFAGQPMSELDKSLFAFASYNAGPGRIRQLRTEAGKRGLDPNKWFGNVELIASERIGRETVTYVSNIYKYYIAYKLVSEQLKAREASRASLTASSR